MTNDEEAAWTKIVFEQTIDDISKHGPTLNVGISPVPFIGNGMRTVRAQIDTGAICSALRPGLAKELGLNKVGEANAHVPGLQPIVAACYSARLFLASAEIELLMVDLATLDPPHDILIGRDILANCRLIVDFTSGLTELHIRLS